jgi:hypothetical protein
MLSLLTLWEEKGEARNVGIGYNKKGFLGSAQPASIYRNVRPLVS